jgi:hypothetical protein
VTHVSTKRQAKEPYATYIRANRELWDAWTKLYLAFSVKATRR